MQVSDIIVGELSWIGLRLATVATAFMLVMTGLGVPHAPLAFLAVPAAVLTGWSVSAPILAYAGTIKGSDNGFNVLFRFIITPLYLFSGTFFPVTQLPRGLQRVASWTPLFHGVELTRGLTLNSLTASDWILHVGFLAGLTTAGTLVAIWTFGRRLRA